MSDEELFGDLGIERVTYSGKRKEDKYVNEAWTLWVELTERPRGERPNRKFITEYRKMLDLRFPHERLIDSIRGAAFLPPRPRDPLDVKRVIAALTRYDVEYQAIALLHDSTSTVYKWKWDEISIFCSVRDIEESCNTSLIDWTARDHEVAGILVSSLTPDWMKYAAQRTRLQTGTECLFPSEVLRWSSIWRGGAQVEVRRMDGRDTYSSGRSEDYELQYVDLNADIQSEKLLLKGYDPSDIRRFHELAPSGYWEAVTQWLEAYDEFSHEDAFSELEKTWNWNPKQRDLPSK